MKKVSNILFVLLFLPIICHSQKKEPLFPIQPTVQNDIVGCSVFTNSNNYTCQNSYVFAAPINNSSGYIMPNGGNGGCLGSSPQNQVWFIITIQSLNSTNLSFSFSNTTSVDVDGAIWGPIQNNDNSLACNSVLNNPLSCDFSTSSIVNLTISNAQVGQKYIMLVNNYSNANTNVVIPQPSGGTVQYCMSNLSTVCSAPTALISGTQTITQGQSANLTLNFTGNSPWNYLLSNGLSGTANVSPLNITVTPTSTTTYTISTVNNICGSGTSSGSAVVTVNPCIPATATLSGSNAIIEGDAANLRLDFTGTPPYNYSLSSGNSGSTSTTPLIVSVSPPSTTEYRITSFSSACGASSTGTATITVMPYKRLLTCFSFNGNSNDPISNNNATVNNAILAPDRFGNPNSAYYFNGINSYLSFPITNLQNQKYTFSMWVKPASLPSTGTAKALLYIGGAGADQSIVMYNDGTSSGVNFISYSGNMSQFVRKGIILNEWHHIVCTRDVNSMKIYVDGVLALSNGVVGSIIYSGNTGQIGLRGSGDYFNGFIDDVKIFRGALSEEEIMGLYHSTNCDFEYQDARPTELIACYPLNGNSIESKNAFNGTIIGNPTPTTDRFGNPNGAMLFDGVDDYISIPGENFVANEITMSAWFYMPTLPTGSQVFTPMSIAGDNNYMQAMQVNYFPALGFASYNTNLSTSSITATTVPQANQWYHMICVRGATQNKLYINGVLQGTNIPNGILYFPARPVLAAIGTRAHAGNFQFFRGKIDDVKIFRGTISDAEALALYNSQDCNYTNHTNVRKAELVACYPFNGNTSDALGVNNGTIIGNLVPTTDRFGNPNNAYQFSNGSYVDITSNPSIITNEYSLSAWVNVDVFNPFSCIMSVGFGGSDAHIHAVGPPNSNHWQFNSYGITHEDTWPTTTNDAVINQWNYIVAVRTLNQMKLYVNGVLRSSKYSSGNLTYNSNSFFRIGARTDAAAGYAFNGKIDDVKIFRGALYDDEVKALYQSTSCGFTPCPPAKLISNQYYANKIDNAGYISANNIINSPYNVEYNSHKAVILKAGFEAKPNTVFKAQILGCTSN